MPFQEITRMQRRQKLALMVISGELNLSQAAREFGVSRPTAYKWVRRAHQMGIGNLAEQSRSPLRQPRHTERRVVEQILAAKRTYPRWGAKKLHAFLWPPDGPEEAPVCVRTVDRLLFHHGLVVPRGIPEAAAVGRFEREQPNQLWQLDFKGLEKRWPYTPLCVLDDHSRFCLALSPAIKTSGVAVWRLLWHLFGEFGLPECLLCDNYAAFNSLRSFGPTWLQARLWLLGIKTCHGRPAHPQTQGKVERFHRTLEDEIPDGLRQADIASAYRAFEAYRQTYNWVRPHEAIAMKVPGAVYRPSDRIRPFRMPKHEPAEGSFTRKVDCLGKFYFKGSEYRVGQGLYGERIELREEDEGFAAYYAGVRITLIDAMRVDPKL
jgi:transposase InsO family protein